MIFEKLTSPRKEKKTPYVPNRDIIRLFSTRPEDRTREQLFLENEECLHHNKTTYGREGEFFQPKNPELIEKFQSTHDYIKNLYEHSKSKFIIVNRTRQKFYRYNSILQNVLMVTCTAD